MSERFENNSIVLEALIETPIPESISWMPQTLGWKIVFAALLVFVLLYLGRYAKNRWRNRYRRECIAALKQAQHQPKAQALNELNRILKLCQRYASCDPSLASLHGQPWLATLDQMSDCGFDSELALAWQQDLLLPEAQQTLSCEQSNQLFAMAQRWILEHPLAVRGKSNA